MLPLPKKQARRRRFFSFLRKSFRWFVGSVFMAMVSYLLVLWVTSIVPFPKEWLSKQTTSLIILDREGKFLHEVPASNGLFGARLSLKQLPKKIVQMTVAAEDHRISKHNGVDLYAIARALHSNVFSGRRVSGASTLAMQVIRQMRPAKRTYTNKVIEMFWAMVLTSRLGKDGVIREYLNRAPYGNRVQGIQRASMLYFDKPACDLSYAESAFLAAIPWGPTLLNPFRRKGKKRALKRAHRILRRAKKLQLMSKKDFDMAMLDVIQIRKKVRRNILSLHWTSRIERLYKKSASSSLLRKTNELRTTLDVSLQKFVHKELNLHLQKLKKRGVSAGSVVIFDHKKAEVLAYVGSQDFFSKENRGSINYLHVRRASGSTIKPFLYAQSMQEKKTTPATLYSDVASTYFWKRGAYVPRNFDFRYLGPIRMRAALGNSRNIPAVRALVQVGVEKSLPFLRSLGMTLPRKDHVYGLGLALGNGEVSLFRLTRAYALLARQGKPMPQIQWVHQARNSVGHIIRNNKFTKHPLFASLSERRVLSQPVAAVIGDILSDPLARVPTFSRVDAMNFETKVALKTGTSQGFRDSWIVGFNSRFTVGCWLGNHDRRRTKRVSGSVGCAPLFKKVMEHLQRKYQKQLVSGFPKPAGWKKHTICSLSGKKPTKLCTNLVEEWLPSGKKVHSCDMHKTHKIDTRNGLLAGKSCPTEFLQTRVHVDYPTGFEHWAREMNVPKPPRLYSPLCRGKHEKKEQVALQITYPIHRSTFIHNPNIPKQFATLGFKAGVKGRTKEVHWFVNGHLAGKSAWPYTFRWPIRQGRFQIVATTSDRVTRSQPIKITIR